MSRQQDYYNEVFSTARELGFSEVQAHMAATQASLETGYGRSVKGNNHFGIKAGKSWSGPTVNFATKEEVNGKMVGQRDSFRGYQDLRDSVLGYGEFMSRSFPETWNAPDINTAVKGLSNGRYGSYATDSKYGSKLDRINDMFGAGVPPVGLSDALQDFIEKNQYNTYASIPVDQSWAALGSMPSMPGIDGLAVNERSGAGIPSAKPSNAVDTSVGPLADKAGSVGAPVSTVTGLMDYLGAPEHLSRDIGAATHVDPAPATSYTPSFQSTAIGTHGTNPNHNATVTANVSNAFGPSRNSIIDGYTEYAMSRAAPVGPQATAATQIGLAPLDAPVDLAARPEVVGPSFNFDNVTATPSSKPGKDKEKDKGFGLFDKSNARGAAIGLLTGGLPGAVVGGLAPTAVRGTQALMGGGLGRLGNAFGGVLDGSPSNNTQALGYARDMAIGNPYSTRQDFLTNYMGAMRDLTGNPNIDPFGGLPRDGRVAAYNQALRDEGLAIGLMEGLSRDLGNAFGRSGGGNSGSGGGRGGSRGGGGRGGMGGRESGSYGADG